MSVIRRHPDYLSRARAVQRLGHARDAGPEARRRPVRGELIAAPTPVPQPSLSQEPPVRGRGELDGVRLSAWTDALLTLQGEHENARRPRGRRASQRQQSAWTAAYARTADDDGLDQA